MIWRILVVNTPLGWVCTLALAALGICQFASHTGQIVAALPYLLLLACPLMYLFMHCSHCCRYGKRECPLPARRPAGWPSLR
ncbi:DUF2933 domain-containing protein [Bosea sp. F3-2]|nr:DUF2933 domain-containing protein [Bosea sp. F3-2]